MARNEEKQLARLNRFYLQKDREEQLKKNPLRPKLETLNSASEIQKWLPSIKKDLDFYVKQTEVPCYPDRTIEEFSHRIDGLKGEYRAFVRKLHQLDPEKKITPWTDRPYSRLKRNSHNTGKITDKVFEKAADSEGQANTNSEKLNSDESPTAKIPKIEFIPLLTPVLHNDQNITKLYGYDTVPAINYNVSRELQDKPLEFCPQHEDRLTKETTQKDEAVGEDFCNTGNCYEQKRLSDLRTSHGSRDSDIRVSSKVQSVTSCLNLPYSDSDSGSNSS